MARFQGVPVEQSNGPRFGGIPVDTKPQSNRALGAVRSALQGATFGFSDEIGLGIAALAAKATGADAPVGDIYREMQQQYGSEQRQFEEESPGLAIGSEIAGGLMTGGIGAAKLAPSATASMGTKLGSYAGAGALSGGVAGAGYAETGESLGESARNVATGAAQGALVGGSVGAALPAAGGLVRGAARPVTNRLARSGTMARRQVAADIGESGMNQRSALAKLRELGPDATLADISDATRSRAEMVGTLPGPGREAARIFEARNAQTGRRVAEDVDRLFGDRIRIDQFVDDIVDQSAKRASPAYQRAFAQPVTITDDLQKLMGRPSIKSAYKQAKRMAADEGVDLPNIDEATPDLRAFDYIKKGLDDLIEKSGKTPMGKVTPKGRTLQKLKSDLVAELDNQVPEYREARKIYSGLAETKQAAEEGQKFWNMTDRQISRRVAEMSDSERDAFRLGALERLYDEAKKVTEGGSAYKRLFGNPEKQDKIRAVLQDEDAFETFRKALLREDAFNRSYQQITQNSRTAARQEMLKEGIVDPGMGTAAAQGRTGDVAASLIRGAMNRLNRPSMAQRGELSQMLMTQGPQAENALAQAFRDSQAIPRFQNRLGSVLAIESGLGSGALLAP